MRRFRLWSLLLLTAVMAYLMAITSGPDEQIASMVLLTGVVLFLFAAIGGLVGVVREMSKSLRGTRVEGSQSGPLSHE